jgi:hypothetical protein
MIADSEPDPKPRTGMRLYIVGSVVVFALALIYVGWVFLSRWQQDRAIEDRAAAEKRTQAQQTFEGMGGERFDILAFYASPGVVNHGDSTTLCYGVSNAKTVTLEPQSNAVWPSYERCVNVSPRKTTTYTLTAADAAGHTKSSTVTVEVR